MFGIFEAQGGSRNSVAGNGQASGPNHATASWTAVAERSGDTAFARAMRLEQIKTFARAKAAWRSRLRCATARQAASRRSPKPLGISRRYFVIRPQFYLNRFNGTNEKNGTRGMCVVSKPGRQTDELTRIKGSQGGLSHARSSKIKFRSAVCFVNYWIYEL